jgi:hypothetical protein
MSFFVVPTATFRLVYAWLALDHSRRRIVHFDVPDEPTAACGVQQLREAFGLDAMPWVGSVHRAEAACLVQIMRSANPSIAEGLEAGDQTHPYDRSKEKTAAAVV